MAAPEREREYVGIAARALLPVNLFERPKTARTCNASRSLIEALPGLPQ